LRRAESAKHHLLLYGVRGKRGSTALANIADDKGAIQNLGAGKGRSQESEEKGATHPLIVNHPTSDLGLPNLYLTRMLHNTAVKSQAWIGALIASAFLHAVLVLPAVPPLAAALAAGKNMPQSQVVQIVLYFAIGWCVVVSAWCALVTHFLSREDNRWGGLSGMRLIGIVAGLTLALDVVNSAFLFMCPAAGLVVPILSAVAVSNISAPLETQSADKLEPPAHG
jgi:hypothetical protein